MYRFNQHSFVGGQLDRGLMGRQDLERYFQGASKLENFIVRKQGNITKRRGTETIADLGNLFGTGNAIAYSRIIPFSQEITEGYYLLLAEEDNPAAGEESSSGDTTIKGAYVLSDKGLLHQVTTTKSFGDTTETSKTQRWLKTCTHGETTGTEERDVEDGMMQTWTVTESVEPFRIEVPYNGAEFKEIGFNQSGDTVFLVHKNHPPAKVVNNSNVFEYSTLDFAFQKWKKPSIISIEKSGIDASGGAVRNISYVCTYVKDGIESMPSEEFQLSYNAPWKEGGIATITCSKGDNVDEPDYYNLYKKTQSDFGLIASIRSVIPVNLSPEVTSLNGTTAESVTSSIVYMVVRSGGSTSRRTYERAGSPTTSFLNKLPTYDISTSEYYSRYNGYYDVWFPVGLGGIKGNGGIKFNFGDQSGVMLSKFIIALDAFPAYSTHLTFYTVTAYVRHIQAGERFKVTVNASKKGTTNQVAVFSETLSAAACEAESTHDHLAGTYQDAGDPRTLLQKNFIADPKVGRRLTVDFQSKFESYCTNTAKDNIKNWQVNSITIEPIDSAGNPAGDFYFCGIEFYNAVGGSNKLQDDYVTPNIAYTPPQASDRFIKSGDYPSCVALYTQRLAFAASTNQPFTWWMSCEGDLYDFSTHASIRQDDALEVTVPATEFPNINHMVLSRDLVLFCDNGEWLVRPLSGNTLAYDTVECKKQSAIGCAKGVPPLQVGDEIIFVDNSRRTIRSIKYQFTSDGYESSDLSILSQSLFFSNPVVSMCYKQHPESLILCELADGTVAALVYMKEHNVVAWTHHTLGGGWKCRGIASNKAHADETTHVAMLVEHPDGGTEVWRVRDDDESNDFAAQICMDGLRFALGSEIGEAAFDAANGQLVVDLETGLVVGRHEDLAAEVKYAIGYPFTSTFVSVRPEPAGNETFQWELKNAKLVHIRTLNGSQFTVKDAGMGDEYASEVDIVRTIKDGEISTPGLVDAPQVLLNGQNSRDGRIEIKHSDIIPLTIESFSVDYETQPLYGSEG